MANLLLPGFPPVPILVIVNVKGFAPFTSAEFDVTAQQSYEVPRISLSVAMADTEVTVRPTDVIAAEQIKAEEKQRFIGVIPNFYVSYVHDPAPMTTKQKFSLASHDTFDPVSLIGVGLAAGIEQANNTYAGYGQGAAGYGKRFAAKFGDGRTSDFLSHAVSPRSSTKIPATSTRAPATLSPVWCTRQVLRLSRVAIMESLCRTTLIFWGHWLRGTLQFVLSPRGPRNGAGLHQRRHRYRRKGRWNHYQGVLLEAHNYEYTRRWKTMNVMDGCEENIRRYVLIAERNRLNRICS
jgi:hypothetical protein